MILYMKSLHTPPDVSAVLVMGVTKSELIVVQVASFDYDSQGLLTLLRKVWVPYWGGARQFLMEEVDKSRFSNHSGATKCVEISDLTIGSYV